MGGYAYVRGTPSTVGETMRKCSDKEIEEVFEYLLLVLMNSPCLQSRRNTHWIEANAFDSCSKEEIAMIMLKSMPHDAAAFIEGYLRGIELFEGYIGQAAP